MYIYYMYIYTQRTEEVPKTARDAQRVRARTHEHTRSRRHAYPHRKAKKRASERDTRRCHMLAYVQKGKDAKEEFRHKAPTDILPHARAIQKSKNELERKFRRKAPKMPRCHILSYTAVFQHTLSYTAALQNTKRDKAQKDQ